MDLKRGHRGGTAISPPKIQAQSPSRRNHEAWQESSGRRTATQKGHASPGRVSTSQLQQSPSASALWQQQRRQRQKQHQDQQHLMVRRTQKQHQMQQTQNTETSKHTLTKPPPQEWVSRVYRQSSGANGLLQHQQGSSIAAARVTTRTANAHHRAHASMKTASSTQVADFCRFPCRTR